MRYAQFPRRLLNGSYAAIAGKDRWPVRGTAHSRPITPQYLPSRLSVATTGPRQHQRQLEFLVHVSLIVEKGQSPRFQRPDLAMDGGLPVDCFRVRGVPRRTHQGSLARGRLLAMDRKNRGIRNLRFRLEYFTSSDNCPNTCMRAPPHLSCNNRAHAPGF